MQASPSPSEDSNADQTSEVNPSSQKSLGALRKTADPVDITQKDPRAWLAYLVFSASFACVLLISAFAIFNAKEADKQTTTQNVMNMTIPLYGTWMGTIMAFYFSRSSFEAATSASRTNAETFQIYQSGAATAAPPDKLANIKISSILNGLQVKETDLTKKLEQVLKEITEKQRTRLIVLNADQSYRTIVYRKTIEAFLTGQANKAALLLSDFINFVNSQPLEAQPKAVFIGQDKTLADAYSMMKGKLGSRDVVVTATGATSEEVKGYLTDYEIEQFK